MSLNAVIIEDNPHAVQLLQADLEAYCPEVKLVGIADGVVSGAKLVNRLQPDLVFLDIEMPEYNGFELLELVQRRHFQVIFTTASEEHAIRAFRFSAIDYLLKPIDPKDLQEAVKRAGRQIGYPDERIKVLRDHLHQPELSRRIALHTQDKIHLVDWKDIVRLQADGNYSLVFFANRSKLLLTRTLKDFATLLEPTGFLRVHQTHLVNLFYVQELVKTEGGFLVLKDGTEIPVSVRKRSAVLEALENLM